MKKTHVILMLACLSTIGCREAIASTVSLTFTPDSEFPLRCPNPTFNGHQITRDQWQAWTKNPSINVTSLNGVKWPKFSEYQEYAKNYCTIVRSLYPNPDPGNSTSPESLFWRPTLTLLPRGIADPFSSLDVVGTSVPCFYHFSPAALFAIASSPAYKDWKLVADKYKQWSDFETRPTTAVKDMANLATLFNLALSGAIGATSLRTIN